MPQRDIERSITEFLDEKINRGLMTGASVAFGDGTTDPTVVNRGTISRLNPRPIDDHTVFDLQSMTKALVTAPLCLALAARGDLQLDDPIDAYLPAGAPRDLAGRRITFRALLTHSAGLSDLDFEDAFTSASAAWRSIFAAPARAPVGGGVEYGDVGYRVLGKLLEVRTGVGLEVLADRLLFSKCTPGPVGFTPVDVFNVAATPDAAGVIDDEQVRALGGIVGCDGLFGSSRSTYRLIRALLDQNVIADYVGQMERGIVHPKGTPDSRASYFDSLIYGAKTFGWEINPAGRSYAGAFRDDFCLEKAGGAGTFAWTTPRTGFVLVYLTNHGKPKPFADVSWNDLVTALDPAGLANVIHAVR